MWAYLRLTPGVNDFRRIVSGIDTDGDGVVSSTEQRAYAGRVLRDVSSVDGCRLKLRLSSCKFPTVEAMKKGLGDISLNLDASIPPGPAHRRLVFGNRHRRAISAHLVNCLAPGGPAFRVTGQRRNSNGRATS